MPVRTLDDNGGDEGVRSCACLLVHVYVFVCIVMRLWVYLSICLFLCIPVRMRQYLG